jgi:hypothetical protein
MTTITAQRIQQQYAVTRARAAAHRAGYRTEAEIRIFVCGALWAAKEMQDAFTLTPKEIAHLDPELIAAMLGEPHSGRDG